MRVGFASVFMRTIAIARTALLDLNFDDEPSSAPSLERASVPVKRESSLVPSFLDDDVGVNCSAHLQDQDLPLPPPSQGQVREVNPFESNYYPYTRSSTAAEASFPTSFPTSYGGSGAGTGRGSSSSSSIAGAAGTSGSTGQRKSAVRGLPNEATEAGLQMHEPLEALDEEEGAADGSGRRKGGGKGGGEEQDDDGEGGAFVALRADDGEDLPQRRAEYVRMFMRADSVYSSPLTRAVQTALAAMAGHGALKKNKLTLYRYAASPLYLFFECICVVSVFVLQLASICYAVMPNLVRKIDVGVTNSFSFQHIRI
jgi:hypothetical protein